MKLWRTAAAAVVAAAVAVAVSAASVVVKQGSPGKMSFLQQVEIQLFYTNDHTGLIQDTIVLGVCICIATLLPRPFVYIIFSLFLLYL